MINSHCPLLKWDGEFLCLNDNQPVRECEDCSVTPPIPDLKEGDLIHYPSNFGQVECRMEMIDGKLLPRAVGENGLVPMIFDPRLARKIE